MGGEPTPPCSTLGASAPGAWGGSCCSRGCPQQGPGLVALHAPWSPHGTGQQLVLLLSPTGSCRLGPGADREQKGDRDRQRAAVAWHNVPVGFAVTGDSLCLQPHSWSCPSAVVSQPVPCSSPKQRGWDVSWCGAIPCTGTGVPRGARAFTAPSPGWSRWKAATSRRTPTELLVARCRVSGTAEDMALAARLGELLRGDAGHPHPIPWGFHSAPGKQVLCARKQHKCSPPRCGAGPAQIPPGPSSAQG